MSREGLVAAAGLGAGLGVGLAALTATLAPKGFPVEPINTVISGVGIGVRPVAGGGVVGGDRPIYRPKPGILAVLDQVTIENDYGSATFPSWGGIWSERFWNRAPGTHGGDGAWLGLLNRPGTQVRGSFTAVGGPAGIATNPFGVPPQIWTMPFVVTNLMELHYTYGLDPGDTYQIEVQGTEYPLPEGATAMAIEYLRPSEFPGGGDPQVLYTVPDGMGLLLTQAELDIHQPQIAGDSAQIIAGSVPVVNSTYVGPLGKFNNNSCGGYMDPSVAVPFTCPGISTFWDGALAPFIVPPNTDITLNPPADPATTMNWCVSAILAPDGTFDSGLP